MNASDTTPNDKTSTENPDATIQDSQTVDDDWAAAMAEQAAASTPAATSNEDAASTPADDLFPPLDPEDSPGAGNISMIMDIPVELSVELGRTRMSIKNILQLGQGSVVELDNLAGEPMDIYINGYLIAQGEVVVVDENYGIRITDIITAADRLNRLNRR